MENDLRNLPLILLSIGSLIGTTILSLVYAGYKVGRLDEKLSNTQDELKDIRDELIRAQEKLKYYEEILVNLEVCQKQLDMYKGNTNDDHIKRYLLYLSMSRFNKSLKDVAKFLEVDERTLQRSVKHARELLQEDISPELSENDG